MKHEHNPQAASPNHELLADPSANPPVYTQPQTHTHPYPNFYLPLQLINRATGFSASNVFIQPASPNKKHTRFRAAKLWSSLQLKQSQSFPAHNPTETPHGIFVDLWPHTKSHQPARTP
jgi:hypothetical protein